MAQKCTTRTDAPKQLAIIGATASGKSDLAIKLANRYDAYILSMDSLAIYRGTDIVSAKPTKQQLESVVHFGIDMLNIDEPFSAEEFIRLYKQVRNICLSKGRSLIIAGGTSFYLKRLLAGLSPTPPLSKELLEEVASMLEDLQGAYWLLYRIDREYMQRIAPKDRYRIEKALAIYLASGLPPSKWFALHPPKPIIKQLPIYEIATKRSVLRERIAKRTTKMLQAGLVEEVDALVKKYGKTPKAMKSIGIVETLEYLEGKIDLTTLQEQITTHTAQLAKRQQTFNKGQFANRIALELESLQKRLLTNPVWADL